MSYKTSDKNEKCTTHSHTGLKFHWCKKKLKSCSTVLLRLQMKNYVFIWQLYFKLELNKLNESNKLQGRIT